MIQAVAIASMSLGLSVSDARAQDDQPPQPAIVVEPTLLDFGKLYVPDTAVKQVTIKNAGNADLILNNLASTCGCTVPKIANTELVKAKSTDINVVIRPGESVIMDVTLNSFGKRDNVEQQVTISTNDPAAPSVIVEVRAFVEPIVRVSPWILKLGALEKGESATHKIEVTTKEPTFKLGRISFGGNRAFKAKVLKTERAEKNGEEVTKATFELAFLGATKPGTYVIEATIRTNYATRRRVTMQVHYDILGDLELPKVLQLGSLQPGQAVEHSFAVKSRSGSAFRILGIEQTGGSDESVKFSATPNDAENPTEYQVTLNLADAPAVGAIRGMLVLETDVVDEESLELRYQGFVRVASNDG